jgi:hypothetical protein
VITWPDGDKSTIRRVGNSDAEVLLNERDKGLLVDNKTFYRFKNVVTGSVISVSPALAGDSWSPQRVDIAEIERRNQERAQRIAAAEQRRIAQEKWEERYENPIARLTVKQLSEEFESNSIVAEDKYAGQMISVTGVVDSIDDAMFDQNSITVSLGVPDGYQCFGSLGCTSMPDMSMASVSCAHKRSDPIVRELKKGMRLEVRGVVYTESMGVGMKNCRYYQT